MMVPLECAAPMFATGEIYSVQGQPLALWCDKETGVEYFVNFEMGIFRPRVNSDGTPHISDAWFEAKEKQEELQKNLIRN